MRHAKGLMLLVVLAEFSVCCTAKDLRGEIVQGGLYASVGEGGEVTVSEVLAFDDQFVYARIYVNSFDRIPRDIDPSDLVVDLAGSDGGHGVTHLSVDMGAWASRNALFRVESVTAEEVDAYRSYLQHLDSN